MPIGLFRNPTIGLYTDNTVTYRYLRFEIIATNGPDPESPGNSAALSEIVILDTNLSGDTNRDGDVDLSDLGALAGNYGKTTGMTWEKGDFNGNGKVNLVDLGLLATNYGYGVSAPLNLAADAASYGLVPEPATLALLCLGGLALLRRRKA